MHYPGSSVLLLRMVSAAVLLVSAEAFTTTTTTPFPTSRHSTTTTNTQNHVYVDTRSYAEQAARPLMLPKEEQEPSMTVPAVTDTASLGTLRVPRVGLGTISWSTDTAADRQELHAIMARASHHPSGTLLDTAERYGSNFKTALGLGWGETERLTRQLLQQEQQHSSSNIMIATKFTPSPWRKTAQSVVEACRQSQKRLYGADSNQPIDLYQLHMPDIVQPPLRKLLGQKRVAPKDELYWDGLAECYHRGLVKNVGVCNYGPTLLAQCQEHLAKRGVPLASNQIAYSILGRHNGAQATLDKGTELGIQTLAFFPFAMGLLTGKYNSNYNGSSSSSSSNENNNSLLGSNKRSRLEETELYRYARGEEGSRPGMQNLLNVMRQIAHDHDKTVAQVALNYIVCKGAIPIPGARREQQFMDNMGAMGWRLSRHDIAKLEEESEALGWGFEGAGFKRTSEKFVGYGVERWTLD